jgi:hypothetical protein
MTSLFEILVCVIVIAILPAVARLGLRLSKGKAAGAMLATGFVFATIFEAKRPPRTEDTRGNVSEKNSRVGDTYGPSQDNLLPISRSGG